jgi:hypothetical protein
MQFNNWKAYVLMPLLSIVTLLILPLRLYWSQELRAYYLYDDVRSLSEATALLVRGKDGNVEIVQLRDLTE